MTLSPTPYEIQNLTDGELMQSARLAILRERDAQLAVLYHLIEIEKRAPVTSESGPRKGRFRK